MRVLTATVMTYPLVQLALVPALPSIAIAFDADIESVMWLMSTFVISSAVCATILGRLGDEYGWTLVLRGSLVVALLGSLVATVAPNLPVLTLGRILQGAAGAAFPLSFALAQDVVQPGRDTRAVARLAAAAGLATGLALLIGGVLTEVASFRYLFWLHTTVLLVLTGLMWPGFAESRTLGRRAVNWAGATVLAITTLLLLLCITAWGDRGRAGATALLAGATLLGGALFAATQRYSQQPLLDWSTLRNPVIFTTNLATILVGLAAFGAFVLVPLYAQADPTTAGFGFGQSSAIVGLLMLPGAILTFAAIPILSLIARRLGRGILLFVGCSVVAMGLTLLAAFHTTMPLFAIGMALALLGVNVAFAGMTSLTLAAVGKDLAGEATGFNSLMRTLGNALGAQLVAAIVASSVPAGELAPTSTGYARAFAVCALASCLASTLAWSAFRFSQHASKPASYGRESAPPRALEDADSPCETEPMEGDFLSALTLDPPGGPWTADDFFALPETHTKVELQDGSYVVSPSPTLAHQHALTRSMFIVGDQCPPDWVVLPTIDVVVSPVTVRRPDVIAGPGAEVMAGSRLDARAVALVIEIVSPDSRATDRLLKPAEYAAADISGYWRVELEPEIRLTVYQLHEGEYVELGTWGPGDTAHIACPIEATIPLDELRWA